MEYMSEIKWSRTIMDVGDDRQGWHRMQHKHDRVWTVRIGMHRPSIRTHLVAVDSIDKSVAESVLFDITSRFGDAREHEAKDVHAASPSHMWTASAEVGAGFTDIVAAAEEMAEAAEMLIP
jgi:hypothetical protein